MPFLSVTTLFCRRVAAPAKRDRCDRVDGVRGDGAWRDALRTRRSASGEGYKKARTGRAVGRGSGDDALVLAAGLPRFASRLRKGAGVGRRAGVGVGVASALLRQLCQLFFPGGTSAGCGGACMKQTTIPIDALKYLEHLRTTQLQVTTALPCSGLWLIYQRSVMTDRLDAARTLKLARSNRGEQS